MNKLPSKLYTPESVAALERLAIAHGIHGYTLMRRAGQAVINLLCARYPLLSRVVIFCGAGNNAGDGYVVARLAQQQGLSVEVVSLIDPVKLEGDALQAYQQWSEVGDVMSLDACQLEEADVIVDALLGTGISREVDGEWKATIEKINKSSKPVVAIDVPSGLDALTGQIKGDAVRADTTITFIGLKTGLFTGSGKACCGDVIFDSLAVPDEVCEEIQPSAYLLGYPDLPARSHDSHKGLNGHVVVIGGNTGMPGAAILAAKAALRSGSGLVSVVTRLEHVCAVAAACPEATVHGSVNGELPSTLNPEISCIAIGPGLGQNAWAHRLLVEATQLARPMVVDADALNLVVDKGIELPASFVITPHPGEAARLLSVSTADIQNDRFTAAKKLHELMAGVVVLKGSGSIVYDGKNMKVCCFGNPAMAVAGMGDVLAGIIAGLIAQGLDISQAAADGVCLHALAGDKASQGNDRGLLASDLIEQLRWVSKA